MALLLAKEVRDRLTTKLALKLEEELAEIAKVIDEAVDDYKETIFIAELSVQANETLRDLGYIVTFEAAQQYRIA